MSRAPFSLGSQPQNRPPALVGPDSTEDRADHGEDEREADHAVDHAGQFPIPASIAASQAEDPPEDVDVGQGAREQSGRVADGDARDVGR